MSEEFMRKRLFRPFATTKSNGLGLGLYTTREVIRAYGGRIDVESEEGINITFRVVLPIKDFGSEFAQEISTLVVRSDS
jgi:signal transduction histidine kinase